MRFTFWHRKQREAELENEIQSHLQMSAREHSRKGESPDHSEGSARREFGNVSLVKETTRDAWGWTSMERLWQDVRYGFRMLRRSPGFTVFAMLTLALGIGANTAIFSVINGVLLRPIPFRDPSRLVAVLETKPSQGLEWLYATGNNFNEWKRRATAFETIAASTGCGFRLADPTEPHLLNGVCASAGFFSMLGVQPIMGRTWTPEEDVPGRDRVAVISYALWKTQFAGDPKVLGKVVWRVQDRVEFTIIGVLPADFQFINDRTAVWAPIALPSDTAQLRFHNFFVYARLKPEFALAQAQQSMTNLGIQLEKEFPKTNTGWGVTVRPLQQFFADQNNARTSLFVLLAAVGLLLLIACANIANLLLARASARQREIAVRMAIGATRVRVLRQLLTESLLLGLLGGASGYLVARAAFRWFVATIPAIPSFEPNAVRLDNHVLLFAIAASILAGAIFGLTPAIKISRFDVNDTLRKSGRGFRGTIRDRMARQLLIVGEIALAVVLLVGTGLLVASLRNLQNDRLGFNPDHILVVPFCCLDAAQYSTQAQVSSFYRQLFQKIAAIPGVESVTASNGLPTRQFDGAGSPFVIQGRPPADPGHETISDSRVVGPDYFQTLQIPTAQGRVFSTQDDENHVPVAVINETLARRHFPGQDSLGQQIQLVNVPPAGRWWTIIGVVANSRDRGLGQETRSMVYIPYLQRQFPGAVLLLRTHPDPNTLASQARATVRSLDRDLSVGSVDTLRETMTLSLAPQRFSAYLLTVFALLALLLASIGVYGVTSYSVAQRTHEMGVRIALGARSRDVLALVVGQGFRLALAGIAVGLVGALALTRFTSSLLFGVSAYDPATLIVVCAILTAVALLACFIPARRATKVDPTIALRYE